MPRIAGINLVGVLLAAIAMYFIGFIVYGLIFMEPFMSGTGMYFTDASKTAIQWLGPNGIETAPADGGEPIWMAIGFLIPLALAWGLAWHMKQKGITTLKTAALFGLWLSLLIGVPLMAYGVVYSPWHSWPAFGVDALHTVATFVVGCAVLSFFD